MIPWIQVYSNLPQHPKTSRLADELGLTSAAFNPNTLAVGLLVCLWTWAIQNATGGDLSSCSPRAIAEACQWKKKPEILIKALIKSGYMDADLKLHDWDDYTAMYQDLQDDTKEKHRDRQKRYRERQKKASVTVTRDACVTSHGDACDAIPYLTRPNLTLPDQKDYLVTLDNLSSPGGGGDAGVPARESDDVDGFLLDRGLDPSVYFGATEEVLGESRAFADKVFKAFTTRRPTKADYSNVFEAIRLSNHDEATDTWSVTLPAPQKDLLMYAFEAASNAGKPGDWSYIRGVLAKLCQRQIKTLGDAEDYDWSRQG